MQQNISPLLNESISLAFEVDSIEKKSPFPGSPIFVIQTKAFNRERIDSDQFSETILDRKSQTHKKSKRFFTGNSKTRSKKKRLLKKSKKRLIKFPLLEVY